VCVWVGVGVGVGGGGGGLTSAFEYLDQM
jgi:hypothetical protein